MSPEGPEPSPAPREHPVRAILFDIDGTLLSTGGAGASAWSKASLEPHGEPVDIERITESGMTDSAVSRAALQSVLGRDPAPDELDDLTSAYLQHLPEAVAASKKYRHAGYRPPAARFPATTSSQSATRRSTSLPPTG